MAELPAEIDQQFKAIERSIEINTKHTESVMDSHLDASAAIVAGMTALAAGKVALQQDFSE